MYPENIKKLLLGNHFAIYTCTKAKVIQHHISIISQLKKTSYKLNLKNQRKPNRKMSRITIIKKSINSKCWKGCGEKGTLLHCWWECKLGQPLWRTVWRFLKKLKIELPYDPAIPLLGTHPEKMKTLIQKDTCTPMFTAALFIIAKTR